MPRHSTHRAAPAIRSPLVSVMPTVDRYVGASTHVGLPGAIGWQDGRVKLNSPAAVFVALCSLALLVGLTELRRRLGIPELDRSGASL